MLNGANYTTRQRVFFFAQPDNIRVMVTQAGQPLGWPVPFRPVSHPRLGCHLERENLRW
ncbi:hypothetical protein [Photorhabdus khanii]|uniref:hypothetical protein n=1 Tax=Photorhabdus khanii TaxID=1004150 RepID=UPI0009DF5EFA